jgi:hypothetical protein
MHNTQLTLVFHLNVTTLVMACANCFGYIKVLIFHIVKYTMAHC